jgi:uncharacterized protein
MRILSLDGGGYLGLATAAFLEELERHFGRRCHDQFDLFCGTSTGAIIALALAAGLSAEEVRKLYEDFGPKVFWNPVPGFRHLRTLRAFFMARYSNGALRRSLENAFGERTLGDLRKSGKFAAVPAFCISSAMPRVFKTDHAENLTRDDGWKLSDIALASSAAPTYLPIVTLKSPTNATREAFCDGGLFANHPALVGYIEALFHLQAHPGNIRLLSVSTPRSDLSEQGSGATRLSNFLLNRGIVLWGPTLASVMIDSTSEIAHQTLKRLTSIEPRDSYTRCLFTNPAGVALDDASRKSTEILRQIGYHKANQTDVRAEVSIFFEAK